MSEHDIAVQDEQLARFLSTWVKPPSNPQALDSVPDDSPDRTQVTLADIHRSTAPDLREKQGALLAPQVTKRYGLEAARPAPCVHTSAAQEFTAAGPGETAANRPRRSDRIPVLPAAVPETGSGLNPWAAPVGVKS
jgi:hypothetical protein